MDGVLSRNIFDRMKTILTVTDFSEAAVNAGKYAAALAAGMHSKLLLLHVFKSTVEIPESYWLYKLEQESTLWMKKLRKEATVINKKLKADIEPQVAHGTAAETIIAEAKRKNAELIVCGMKGTGKLIRKLFGSTAVRLAEKSTVPLLIIPEGIAFRKPLRIMLAVDLSREPFPYYVNTLQELNEIFNAQLSILSIVSEDTGNNSRLRIRYSGFADKLKTMNPEFSVITGTNIPKLISKCITDNKIDMLVLLSHRHELSERIFGQSVTQRMSFLSTVPLLLLPPKKESHAKALINLKEQGLFF